MPGAPKRTFRRQRWLALKQNPDFLAHCVEWLADGGSYRKVAEAYDIPYRRLHEWLYKEQGIDVQALRRQRAEDIVEQCLVSADRVEAGELDSRAAKIAANIRLHHASQLDPANWKLKTPREIDQEQMGRLHLEALRQLSGEDQNG